MFVGKYWIGRVGTARVLILYDPQAQEGTPDGRYRLWKVDQRCYAFFRSSMAGGCRSVAGETGDWDAVVAEYELLSPYIFTSGNVELFRNLEIEWLVRKQGVERLVHFTDIRNIPGIAEFGILSRLRQSEVYAGDRRFSIWYDPHRLDEYYSAVSLSITHPNTQMLRAVRCRTSDSYPVILLLSPSILYELDCAFFPKNASSHAMRSHSSSTLRSPRAFRRMFYNPPYASNEPQRRPRELRIDYTVDEQAEVLVFNDVTTRYITHVAFESWAAANAFKNHLPPLFQSRVIAAPELFHRRDQIPPFPPLSDA